MKKTVAELLSTGNYAVAITDNKDRDSYITEDFRNWIRDSKSLTKLDRQRYKDEYIASLEVFKKLYKDPSSIYKTFSKVMLEGEYINSQADLDKFVEGMFLLSSNFPDYTFNVYKSSTSGSYTADYPYQAWFNNGRAQVARAELVQPKLDKNWTKFQTLDKKDAPMVETVQVAPPAPTPPAGTPKTVSAVRQSLILD